MASIFGDAVADDWNGWKPAILLVAQAWPCCAGFASVVVRKLVISLSGISSGECQLSSAATPLSQINTDNISAITCFD
jgi:hypothetical protein